MDDLLKRASRRWRRAMKAAESNGLDVAQGADNELFDVLVGLHKEMIARKGFLPGVDMEEFARIQEALPPALKMQTMVARAQGEPVAALAASLVGEKGVGLVGATSATGLNLGGFHLLNMRMMAWLKERGARWYDFGGYDPEKNPGTATFKDGLPGIDVSHIGRFECCVNRLSALSIRLGEHVLNARRAGRAGRGTPTKRNNSQEENTEA
ncbi:MAG: GNAT family N-acetyltransferase [Syntrophorhabdales bacterium]